MEANFLLKVRYIYAVSIFSNYPKKWYFEKCSKFKAQGKELAKSLISIAEVRTEYFFNFLLKVPMRYCNQMWGKTKSDHFMKV